MYEDEKIIQHPAWVIGYAENYTIFIDEYDNYYFCNGRIFEPETVTDANVLSPLTTAEDSIKNLILPFLEGAKTNES